MQKTDISLALWKVIHIVLIIVMVTALLPGSSFAATPSQQPDPTSTPSAVDDSAGGTPVVTTPTEIVPTLEPTLLPTLVPDNATPTGSSPEVTQLPDVTPSKIIPTDTPTSTEADKGNIVSDSLVLPTAPILVAPSGLIKPWKTNPTFIWKKVTGATVYQLYIQVTGGGLIFSRWDIPENWNCGNTYCSFVLPSPYSLSPGSYLWKVRASNISTITGIGLWSVTNTFNCYVLTEPTLGDPKGVITPWVRKPTFQWTAVTNAAKYLLTLKRSTGVLVYQAWFTASAAICPTYPGTCSVTPSLSLATGIYNWTVRGSTVTDLGPISPATTFYTPKPLIVTVSSPSGEQTNPWSNNIPFTFTWISVDNVDSYNLIIKDRNLALVLSQWYTPSGVRCSTSAGLTCSITPSLILPKGYYYWWVQAKNGSGLGPISAAKSFWVTSPGSSTIYYPSAGNMVSNTNIPYFKWYAEKNNLTDKISNATKYYLKVQDDYSYVYNAPITKEAAGCPNPLPSELDGTTPTYGDPWKCGSIYPKNLAGGHYTWSIRPWNLTGYGTVSSTLDFYLPNYSADFSDPLTRATAAYYYNYWWTSYRGAWSYNAGTSTTAGRVQVLAPTPGWYSVGFKKMKELGNFVYEVKMRRSCVYDQKCINALYIRGTPTLNSLHDWDTAYSFEYSGNKHFAVYKGAYGRWGALFTGYTSPAINITGWNTLRVQASQGSLTFYINNTLVWAGVDSSLKTGIVGISMYSPNGSVGDYLYVQKIRLSPPDMSPSPPWSFSSSGLAGQKPSTVKSPHLP